MEPRIIATAATQIPVDPKFGGGTIEERATITEYVDERVVVVSVDHYDGHRAVEFDLPTWRAFRAAIIADDRVAENT